MEKHSGRDCVTAKIDSRLSFFFFEKKSKIVGALGRVRGKFSHSCATSTVLQHSEQLIDHTVEAHREGDITLLVNGPIQNHKFVSCWSGLTGRVPA
jgi:hypothetical protein